MADDKPSTSGVINVAGLEAQLAAALAKEVLGQIRPSLDHAEKCAASTKSLVTRGGYGGLSLLVVLALVCWNAYADAKRAREKRDDAVTAQLNEITKSLAASMDKAKERDETIATLQGEVVRLTRAVNALSRKVWPTGAEPVATPFPDAVTTATR